jgi:hypothetical protein
VSADWEKPLTSPEAWVGVWFRGRNGPTKKGITIHVERWHRVETVEGDRINTVCRPSWRKPWPSGGARMEIARLLPWTELPGDICPKCGTSPVLREIEVAELTDDIMDDLASRVAERLLERMPK